MKSARGSDTPDDPTSYRQMRVVLPRVVAGVKVVGNAAQPSLLPGDVVKCTRCTGTHVVIPCSSPSEPMTFIACQGQLMLAALREHAFFTKVTP